MQFTVNSERARIEGVAKDDRLLCKMTGVMAVFGFFSLLCGLAMLVH
jgi:hypothetical protein